MNNNNFPLDLQLEILSYVPHIDKLEYARCNRSVCCELMRRLRIITIRTEKIEYLSSESFRNKILGLLVDPYEQLELQSNYPENGLKLPENLLVSDLVLRTLDIPMSFFSQLLPHLTRVQHLILNQGGKYGTISQIAGLRKLSLFCCPNPSLASLSDGVSLHQHLDLRSLRYLKLYYCNSICDVSSLDHIYELHLIDCSAIVDISCLNNNKIIVIELCPVRDYSESFRFSREITIISSQRRSDVEIKGINLNKLEAVQSLTISFDQKNNNNALQGKLPSSLRYLSLKLLKPRLHSLKTMLEKIRVVKIDRCHDINDWSPLQENKNVVISFCNGFMSGEQLTNVKRLTFIHCILNHMEDLKNITDLKLEKSNFIWAEHHSYIKSSALGKKLFSSANKLTEIEFDFNFKYPDISILHLIMESPSHKRIIINLYYDFDKSTLETLYRQIVQEYGRFYEVEIKLPKQIVLLKKEYKNEGRSWFSLILISLGIVPILGYFMTQS